MAKITMLLIKFAAILGLLFGTYVLMIIITQF